MTTQQISMVQQSFEWVKPMAQEAGELFYQKLFVAAPEAQAMFKAPIKEQAGKLMYMLAYVVKHLHTPEVILSEVASLGRRHQQYGAQPEHYDLVGAVLLDTLATAFGNRWIPEMEKAWAAAYSMIANAMMDASSAKAVA